MILERRTDDFVERNLFLQLTMGLIAAGDRLDELLENYAPVREDPPSVPQVDGDDAGALFILGLIAFRQRVMVSVSATPPSAASAPSAECASGLEDLLR